MPDDMSSILPGYLRQQYPFAANFADTHGKRMHYVEEGKGTPVLMLHGNPTWSFFYRNVIKALSGHKRCIAPDHIGCGLSEKPRDRSYYNLEQHIDNIEALCNHLHLNEFDLMVHDWGGAIGFGLAARMPERVRRLVVLNTAAFPARQIPMRIAACRIPLIGRFMVEKCNAFARAAQYMTTVKTLPGPVRRAFIYPYRKVPERVAVSRFVEDIPMKPEHPSYALLESIGNSLAQHADKPMLICWGLKDWCFTPFFLSEWIRRFPMAQVVEAQRAGHYLLEDEGDLFISRIKQFLSD